MANSNPKPLPSGISLGDITYVLFKHKWKIILFSFLCAAAAAVYYWKADPPFISQSKLMVRYVVNQSIEDDFNTTVGTDAGRQMESIMDGQLAILTSWDVASTVATNVACSQAGLPLPLDPKELPKYTPEEEVKLQRAFNQLIGDTKVEMPRETRNLTLALKNAATSAILQNLTASAERGTAVIQVAFRHPKEVIPTLVLKELIHTYKLKHNEIHRPPPTTEALNTAMDKAKEAQDKTNTALVEELAGMSVSSVAEGQELYGTGLATAHAELQKAEADYSEQQTRVAELEKLAGLQAATKPDDTNKVETPPATAAVAPENPATAAENPASAAAGASSLDSVVVNNYRSTLASLEMARQRHSADAMKYAPGHEGLQTQWRMIQELEAKRIAMEKANPQLTAVAPAVPALAAGGPGLDLAGQRVELAALKKRLDDAQLRNQRLAEEAKKFNAVLPRLLSLQQQLDIDRENYKSAQLQNQRWGLDTLLDNAKKTPNIKDVQDPTPATKDVRMRDRIALGLLAGGPLLGIGITLLFGLLLNRTIKRPLEIEEGLGMPLMMSIPYYTKKQRLKSMRPMGAGKATKALQEIESGRGPWEKSHFIHPYAEAVRDRLMMYFEATGNIRKPKLIAVTGYSVGAGTSTVAAGLASSLSEIGDGKVLLVDMSGSQGAAHPFFDGEPAVSITKALRLPGLTNGITKTEVGENRNLVVARADSPAGGITSIGLRRLMPELKASEFDYIVFDMPPLGQTKPTATVAGMMDKVLVVVEAETNTRSDVRRGYRDLVQAGANASVLFNKARTHGPKALAGSIG
jgi:succinoglycan biosynthesis transport protein ExoP